MPRVLPDLAAVDALADELAAQLRPGDCLLLDGPLGAGKTTFVRALVRALDGDPRQVSSPTFTLLHQYEARVSVIHVDAYRLASDDELEALAFDELRVSGIACVEWAERVAGALPSTDCWHLAFAHHDGRGRTVMIDPPQRDPPEF